MDEFDWIRLTYLSLLLALVLPAFIVHQRVHGSVARNPSIWLLIIAAVALVYLVVNPS